MTEMVSVEVLNRFDRYDYYQYYHIITFFPRVEVVVVLLHSLNIYQDQERVLCLHTNPHTVTSSLISPPAEARRHRQRGCPGAEAGGGRGGGAGRVHEGQQGLIIVPPGGEMFTLAQGCSHVSPVLTTGHNIDIDCAVPSLNQLVHSSSAVPSQQLLLCKHRPGPGTTESLM